VSFADQTAPVVVDASVAIDGLLDDPVVTAAWRSWIEDDRLLLAPPLVWSEVGQALLRRMPALDVAIRLEMVEAAGLGTADRGARGAGHAAGLAERHRLSVYDATYLWLAIDVDGALATRDRALARAAVAEGVALALEA
jgi:predicted nucleic acid-binding protein